MLGFIVWCYKAFVPMVIQTGLFSCTLVCWLGLSQLILALLILWWSFCKRGDIHKAVHIVDEMVIHGCVPAERIWNAVVGAILGLKESVGTLLSCCKSSWYANFLCLKDRSEIDFYGFSILYNPKILWSLLLLF